MMNSDPYMIVDFGDASLNPGKCLKKCNLAMKCHFFSYLLNNSTCELFTSPEKKCLDIMGQPKRAMATCYEGPDDEISEH